MKDKYVFVTGGDRGIGRAIVLKFASSEFNVAFSYHKNEVAAKETFKRVKEYGVEGFYVQMDVLSEESVKKCFEMVSSRVPYLNVLVNNAGITKDNLLIKMTKEEWDDVIRVNLSGAFYVTKIFIDHLIETKGSIIYVSSVVGQDGNIGQANYAASKAGLIGLTRALAMELARYGIRVNAIAPGFTETEMTAKIPEKVKEKIIARIPLRRFALPEEIAKAVIFLASDEASYITGVTMSISGGQRRE